MLFVNSQTAVYALVYAAVIQCIWKVFTALHFSTFCYVTALFQNWLYSLFSSNFYKQYPIMTMCKKFVWNLCKCIKNKNRKNNHIRIHSLCSILCWSTFDTNYSLKSFGVWCYKLGTPIFWAVSPVLLCRTSQALSGWMGTVGVQPFSDLSRDVQSGSSLSSGWATQGHPLLCYLGCVLRVIVLLNRGAPIRIFEAENIKQYLPIRSPIPIF